MSGEVKVISSGYQYDEVNGEQITLSKLNRQVEDATLEIQAGAVDTRELADNSVTADKLDTEISAQLGVPDGAVTNAKLAASLIVPVSKGGTGGTTAPTGRAGLGVAGVGAVEQALLTGTYSIYNHASETVDPEEGLRGDDEAFWLVADDNGDSMELTLATYNTSSKVKIDCVIHCDTDYFSVAVGFKLQRSIDSGSSWTDLGLGDSSSTRVRITFLGQHGDNDRNMGKGVYTFVDEPNFLGDVMYRVLMTVHPNNRLYINRDYGIDRDGDAGGVSTAEYRCSSNMVAQEIRAAG